MCFSDDNTLSFWVDGETYSVALDHPNLDEIKECVKNEDEEGLKALLDVGKAISLASDGKVVVENGCVMYNGEEIRNSLTKRILQLMRADLPVEPLCKFLENLYENPSMASLDCLYDFLEKNEGHPITEDGHFLAYRVVRPDFKDKYSGTIDNSVGSTPNIPRNQVDNDRSKGCSKGLHVGNLEYVRSYGSVNDKFLLIKVNPRDVVSVPTDCNFQKMRVCEYHVVSEHDRNQLLKGLLYSKQGKEVVGSPSTPYSSQSDPFDSYRDDDDPVDDFDDYDDEDDDYGWPGNNNNLN